MRRHGPRLLLAMWALLVCAAASPRAVLYEKQSPYTFIAVTEDAEGLRYLQFDQTGALQSVVRPGHPLELELPYTQVSMVGLAFVPAPKRILVVGLGGGAMPMFLRAVVPGARIDVVDIDPDVVDVAKRYFGFREDDHLRAHVADGRRFVEAAGPPYDLIFLDAYGPDSIPQHLATVEFLTSVRARLAKGGAVVGNLWEDPPNARFDAMVRTWQVGFTRLYTFDVRGSANRILVGVQRAEKQSRAALESRAETLERAKSIPFDLSALVAAGYADATEREPRGEVLKDAAPVPAQAP
ncbi:fused MFS/spermidine synthase [Pyxidicoccus caerfyrddinensis]|uniref:spermidine synthase n=1 Tax=Pyxidicoccus caerfyrddinensis TaxID=2709663 RepID=UPI0013D9B2A2